MKIILFSFIVLTSFLANALPEAQVAAKVFAELLPYVQNNYKRLSFQGVGNKKINYYSRAVANPKAVLIISPGRTESSLKWVEFLYDIQNWGYTVYIIDHRGQGESERLVADSNKGHVDRFSDYVDDFSYFVNQVVHPENYKKSYILAHSMGGAIVTGFLRNQPQTVTAVVMTSPMLEINAGLLGPVVSDSVANALIFAGRGSDYAPTQKPFNPDSPFAGNKLTTSAARFGLMMRMYNKYPDLQVGGTTVSWLKESIEYTSWLRYTPNLYQVPTLLMQAEKDQIVMPYGQHLACEVLSPENCKLMVFTGSQHEILQEKDTIRNRGMAAIEAYFKYFDKQ